MCPSAIKEWWQAKTAIVIKENNGIYVLSWGEKMDDPEFITVSIIRKFKPHHKLRLEYLNYFSKAGKLPFEAKMYVDFVIDLKSESCALLCVEQGGIPDDQIANQYYNACITGWNSVLENIKNYCEGI